MSRTTMMMIALLILGGIQSFYHYTQMPETVATHFNAQGEADDFMSRTANLYFNLGLLLLFAILFSGISWLVGALPASWINMPNKDYWLAPERRDVTQHYLRREMIRLGNATILLLLAINYLAYKANQASPPQLSHAVWVIMILYIAYMIIWTVGFYRKFNAVPR